MIAAAVLIVYCVSASCLMTPVDAHGYLLHPMSRQYPCYRNDDFWWPSDGSNITDGGCKSAYQYMYNKHGGNAFAAQYMFNQYAEYAALAGTDFTNAEHVRNDVVAHHLCAAGANDSTKAFGDKSGIDVWWAPWSTTELDVGVNKFVFCPTVIHEPSYFEVFITNELYEYKDTIQWSDLDLIYNKSSILEYNTEYEECDNEKVYVLRVNVPYRTSKFVIYVRWQRRDIAGEGFYNCADAIIRKTPAVVATHEPRHEL
jgi:predicted carbohydrate-binding protein with CBM5 and CBM33 domain